MSDTIAIRRDTSREVLFTFPDSLDLTGYALSLTASWSNGSRSWGVGSGLTFVAPRQVRWRYSVEDSNALPEGRVTRFVLAYDAPGPDRDSVSGWLLVGTDVTNTAEVVIALSRTPGTVSADLTGIQGPPGPSTVAAEAARDAAIAARDASVSARDASVTARDAAVVARTGAEAARDDVTSQLLSLATAVTNTNTRVLALEARVTDLEQA